MVTVEKSEYKPKKLPDLNDTDASTWFEVRKHFLLLSKKITENYLKQMAHVATLQDNQFPYLAEFLADCEVPEHEVDAFLLYGSTLRKDAEDLEKHAVPPATINALIRADSDVRQSALRSIRSRHKLSVDDFPGISSSLVKASMSDDMWVIESSKRAFGAAFEAKAKRDEDVFRKDAGSLHNQMVTYANNPSEKLHSEICELAQSLLRRFEKLFGSDFPSVEDWLLVGLSEPDTKHLAQAHYALTRISEGAFRTGFPWLESRHTRWFSDASIRYLAGITDKSETQTWKKSPADLQRLTAIQLGTDCGGLTLGLEAARFDIVAVAEIDWDKTVAFRENRPSSKIESIDLRNADGLAQLSAQRNGSRKLDLIAGNLNELASNQVEKLERLSAAIDCVVAVAPRAFVFQVDPALYGAKAGLPLRKKLQEFCHDQGYRFDTFDVRASDFGVAQKNRVDTFIVGVEHGSMCSRFTPPGSAPRYSDLASVLFNHAFPYRSETWNLNDDAKDTSNPSSDEQRTYDRWARKWLEKYGDKLAPKIIDRVKGDEKKWTNVGLTMSLHEKPLEVGHDDATSGKPLPLTLNLLALLNGFPVGWHFPGNDIYRNVENLTKAVPPPVAQAVASALRTALTGEELDNTNPEAFEIGRKLPSKPKFIITPEDSSHRDRFLANEWRRAMIEQVKLDQMLDDDDSDDD